MLAINAKRGVESTVERVFNSTGNEFSRLHVLWTGSTAGIIFNRRGAVVDAKIVFPAIDEGKEMKRSTFNNLIGYAIHELGHAWFTENKPWDQARSEYGQFVGNLINGLEDPRIERKVIESGYAPNAKALFEELLNSILKKNGYVEADDLKNVPFLLAVEGRRLNGYHIDAPSVTDLAPWSADLHWALAEAQVAPNTQRIAEIAIELFKRLKDFEPEPKGDGEDEGDDDQDGDQDGDGDGDKPTDQEGDDQDGDGNDQDGNDQDGDKGGDGRGKPTKPTDGDGDKGGQGGEKGSEGGDQPSDKGEPTDENKSSEEGNKNGGGKEFAGGRNVEPSEFIEGELKDQRTDLNPRLTNRPSSAKPTYATFEWR
jgi:hypothetical protein